MAKNGRGTRRIGANKASMSRTSANNNTTRSNKKGKFDIRGSLLERDKNGNVTINGYTFKWDDIEKNRGDLSRDEYLTKQQRELVDTDRDNIEKQLEKADFKHTGTYKERRGEVYTYELETKIGKARIVSEVSFGFERYYSVEVYAANGMQWHDVVGAMNSLSKAQSYIKRKLAGRETDRDYYFNLYHR